MKTKTILILLSATLILSAGGPALPVRAQGGDHDQHPLIRMLSAVPAEVVNSSDSSPLRISYADIRAAEHARPGAPSPAAYAELEAMDSTTFRLWNAATMRLTSFTTSEFCILLSDASMTSYLGLDVFEVDQWLEFTGTLQGLVYTGHFDIDLIRETLTRRTYTLTESHGIPVLCGPAGCENGETAQNWLPDTGSRDPVTLRRAGVYPIFGGRQGQQQPIGLLPGMLLSTAPWDTLTAMTAAATGEASSLYQHPEFRTIADFAVNPTQAAGSPQLIQLIFLQPRHFNPDLLAAITSNLPDSLTPGDIEAAFERMGFTESGKPVKAADLPPYTRGAIVDWQSGPDQMHSIVLVYDNEVDALTAAAEVLARIPRQTAYIRWLREDPVIELAVSEYTLEPPQAVYNAVADRWLAVATVRTPTPGNEPTDPADPRSVRSSGALVSYWFDSILYDLFMPVMLPAEE